MLWLVYYGACMMYVSIALHLVEARQGGHHRTFVIPVAHALFGLLLGFAWGQGRGRRGNALREEELEALQVGLRLHACRAACMLMEGRAADAE